MISFHFSEYARQEFSEITKYYENCRPGLGREFIVHLKRGLQSIRRTPLAFSLDTVSETRRFVMRRFPYLVHYTVEADRITIVAIAHQKRKPRYWLDL